MVVASLSPPFVPNRPSLFLTILFIRNLITAKKLIPLFDTRVPYYILFTIVLLVPTYIIYAGVTTIHTRYYLSVELTFTCI